jgi:hypothetical protein
MARGMNVRNQHQDTVRGSLKAEHRDNTGVIPVPSPIRSRARKDPRRQTAGGIDCFETETA